MEVEVEHDGQSDRIHDEIDLQTKNIVRNDLAALIHERNEVMRRIAGVKNEQRFGTSKKI